MRVQLIPVLSDNYSYLIVDDESGRAAVVDPSEAGPVLAAVEAAEVQLEKVLCTHYHWDHVGGIDGLRERHPDLQVVAGEIDGERISSCDVRLADGETVRVGRLEGRVLFVPCHTRGHVAYFFEADSENALFCGDMLFVGGCGRFFEGTAQQMHRALNEVFAALPTDTAVYCGHEYTVSNFQFALSVDADNRALQDKMRWAKAQRRDDRPTVPSTLGEERTYNPFMRVDQPALQQAVGATDPVEVMARLRERKNRF
jgi:hydroxyacylglutathione hydrolase